MSFPSFCRPCLLTNGEHVQGAVLNLRGHVCYSYSCKQTPPFSLMNWVWAECWKASTLPTGAIILGNTGNPTCKKLIYNTIRLHTCYKIGCFCSLFNHSKAHLHYKSHAPIYTHIHTQMVATDTQGADLLIKLIALFHRLILALLY